MTYVTILCLIAISISALHCAPVDETNPKEPAGYSELSHINSKAASLADSHVMTIDKSDPWKTDHMNGKPGSIPDEAPNALKSSSPKQEVPASTTASTTATSFIK
ncbi:hypothetical protein RN001_010170 [Aquatica leii]|uniref:Secreted protein n=1 Tax=Aquatica leii TaxID=1421715 RepID=A0AAN7SFY2_9COLE|nr:hypothetical protein RN001_010170 [Aquatica leii]